MALFIHCTSVIMSCSCCGGNIYKDCICWEEFTPRCNWVKESLSFQAYTVIKPFVKGPVSERPTAWEKMRVETVKDNTSRLLREINKLFFSLCFFLYNHARTESSCGLGDEGRQPEAAAHTLAVPTCLHGVSSVSPSWESSPVFSGSLCSAPEWHKGPFMPESGSIHGC